MNEQNTEGTVSVQEAKPVDGAKSAITVIGDRVIQEGHWVEGPDGKITYVQTAEDRGEYDRPVE